VEIGSQSGSSVRAGLGGSSRPRTRADYPTEDMRRHSRTIHRGHRSIRKAESASTARRASRLGRGENIRPRAAVRPYGRSADQRGARRHRARYHTCDL